MGARHWHPAWQRMGGCALSAAGLLLGVKAYTALQERRLSDSLYDAGWALHFVLAPFADWRGLWRKFGRPLSMAEARRSRWLPPALAPLSLLANCLLLASIVVDIADKLP